MDWTAWRDEFPLLASKTYLNSCSLGALSTRVRAAVVEHLDAWDASGASAWYGPWMETLAETRASFARLVGAREDEVALLPNVSSALAVVGSGLDVGERDEVVMTALDFPTLGHHFHARDDVDVRFAASPDGIRVEPEAAEAHLGERTVALATSHVCFTSGFVQNIGRLSRAARDAGALSIIDAYQGTGQLPTDVRSIGCDVLITGGLKWLLGGTGISYLYVSRDAQERLSPRLAGWFGDAQQFAFDVTRFRPRDDARRYELGTPPLPSVFAGRAGLDIVHEIGPERLRARQTELVNDLFERCRDAGLVLLSPDDPHERAGIVMVQRPDPQATVAALAERDVVVDARPGRVRLSPYFYNTTEENAAVVEAMVDVERKAGRL